MLKKTDLAYIAGLVDGEGCIYIDIGGEKHRCYRLHLVISNTYYPILEYIKEKLGGRIQRRSVVRGEKKACWGLEWNAVEVAKVLGLVYPYLKIKKAEAQVALLYQIGRQDGRKHKGYTQEDLIRHKWFYEELKRLKRYDYGKVITEAADIQKE
jgi:hypothetical protein